MTEKDIEKLAELAKIRIPEGKAEAFLKDFESILDYVKQIESVDLSVQPEVGELEQNFFLKNIMRVDENPNVSGVLSEALLSSAPASHEGFVKVNKIL